MGVPPYLSTYVRDAYHALRAALPEHEVAYVTIDDVRWQGNGDAPLTAPPLSDKWTYAATANRPRALELIAEAPMVVVVAGDKVPSVHQHAVNASPAEIRDALADARGRKVLLGPMSTYALTELVELRGVFDALHTHTVTSTDLHSGSRTAAGYEQLAADRGRLDGLTAQMPWTQIAEIELYRGCTRRRFCAFCNEPVKAPAVAHREVSDVLDEIRLLADAGVRHFRLGQQTCFFSYRDRDSASIRTLLEGIRETAPDLEVLHIDNADPLAVASKAGARIAKLVAEYCTEGNCAPMGIESFDPTVIERNTLTCTPEILMRAVENVNTAGAHRGPGGLPMLLPGLNLIYGLPGQSPATHQHNLRWLRTIFDSGYLCHRTNVRELRVFPGTALESVETGIDASTGDFDLYKAQLDAEWDEPMKRRVYPLGLRVTGTHAFFTDQEGTWFRRLGSYPIQIKEIGAAVERYRPADMTVTGHTARYIYGQRHAA